MSNREEELTQLIVKIRNHAKSLRHAKVMIEEYLTGEPYWPEIREIPSAAGIRRKDEPPKICTVNGCYDNARARGICMRHYKQLQRLVGGRFTHDTQD